MPNGSYVRCPKLIPFIYQLVELGQAEILIGADHLAALDECRGPARMHTDVLVEYSPYGKPSPARARRRGHVLARYRRSAGEQVRFQAGTDLHAGDACPKLQSGLSVARLPLTERHGRRLSQVAATFRRRAA